jgi:hypothetical protein
MVAYLVPVFHGSNEPVGDNIFLLRAMPGVQVGDAAIRLSTPAAGTAGVAGDHGAYEHIGVASLHVQPQSHVCDPTCFEREGLFDDRTTPIAPMMGQTEIDLGQTTPQIVPPFRVEVAQAS